MIELKTEQLSVQFQTFGGALSSIKDKDGIEYLWQGDPTYWSGQAPVLFPICGSVRNDTVCFIHFLLHLIEFFFESFILVIGSGQTT